MCSICVQCEWERDIGQVIKKRAKTEKFEYKCNFCRYVMIRSWPGFTCGRYNFLQGNWQLKRFCCIWLLHHYILCARMYFINMCMASKVPMESWIQDSGYAKMTCWAGCPQKYSYTIISNSLTSGLCFSIKCSEWIKNTIFWKRQHH